MSFTARKLARERLMSRMADRNGADLDVAVMTGALSPEELSDAALSCLACTNPEDCAGRLEAGEEGIPEYCRNAALIRSVAQLLG